jgi:uncharacterized protein YjbI with pentapeptide repeats
MSAHSTEPQRPNINEREAWPVYWQAQGMTWRGEPEIDEQRQQFLAERRDIVPDLVRGVFPFGGITLTRGDIEWLLATHVSLGVYGPVVWDEEKVKPDEQRRVGLDLRGAHLEGLVLALLPLARLRGGLSMRELNQSQTTNLTDTALALDRAAVHMEKAILYLAELTDAQLQGAHLEQANLISAHLEKASLSWAHIDYANLSGTHLEGAHLGLAHLERCQAPGAHLEGAALFNLRASGADFFEAHMEATDCNGADFTGARFGGAFLHGANLSTARLEGAVFDSAHLEGREVPADDLARIHQWAPKYPATLPSADLRGVVFDSRSSLRETVLGDAERGAVALVDARLDGVNLAVVDWTQVQVLRDEQEARSTTSEDGKNKEAIARLAQFRAAARANRQLAVALRDQGLNEEADHFAYRAQILHHEVLRRQRALGPRLFSLFLWVVSGYGYRLRNILTTYIGVLLLFTVIYWLMGVHSFRGEPGVQALWDSFLVSLSAIHGRTTFEQLGAWSSTAWVAAVESVLGIIVEGVFVAMLIQRFFTR